MDSLTQAALGAAMGEAVIGKKIGGKGALLGAILGTIPDLDVLLTPFFTEFQKVSLHRGYSHSILFCLLGATLAAFVLTKVTWTKEISYRKLWFFTFLTLFTHVLLDSFTSYGTQLFLPLTDWRVSFDSISIIDPVYTLPLLCGVLLSVFYYKTSHPRRGLPNNIGLLVSSLYLLFTLANKQNIQKQFYDQFEKNNITFHRLLTVPVAIGNVNWYGVAKDEKNLYIGKYSLLANNEVEFHRFPVNEQLLQGVNPQLVDRMKWFAQDFYTVAEKDGKVRIYNMQCDMQGVRNFGDYKAPTAFYYEITTRPDGSYDLSSGMHPRNPK